MHDLETLPFQALKTASLTSLIRREQPEVHGVADQRDVLLPSGVVLRRKRIGYHQVTDAQMQAAAAGIMRLPLEHQRYIAQLGVPIELVPVAALENGILGATTINERDSGLWQPTHIRIAARAGKSGGREELGEIVQHEIGHVVAMGTSQNRTEEAAESYAARY